MPVVFEMGDAGPETTAKSSGKTPFVSTSGAENGALEPRLVMVIDAWPMLSEHCRLIIVGLVQSVAVAAAENQKN
jgi:hypothetical protein